jgi:serine/threonine protein kinase
VYKGICKRSKETVVLKSYTLSAICELYQHQIYREVRLHSSLHHENIVKLFAAFKVGGASLGRVHLGDDTMGGPTGNPATRGAGG